MPSLSSVQTEPPAGKDPWSTLPRASVRGMSSGQRESRSERHRHGKSSHFMLPAVGSSTKQEKEAQYNTVELLSLQHTLSNAEVVCGGIVKTFLRCEPSYVKILT